MTDRIERLMLLPFAVGCISESSIPVVLHQTKRLKKLDAGSTLTSTKNEGNGYMEKAENLPPENLKRSVARLQKLFKNLKNFSHLFVHDKEGVKVEEEMEINIGFPTDVKHVTHVGLDDFPAGSDLFKSWNDLTDPEYDINVFLTSDMIQPFQINKM